MKRWTTTDWLALLLSLAAFGAALAVAGTVFENIPHLEDEMAYVWQAQVIAGGQLTLPSPPCPRCFLVPFVVDYQGMRFGKYPLGWPVLLAVAIWLGGRGLLNPLLAGLAVWLTYLLGKRLLDGWTALLAAGLLVLSPFFLINSGSLLSHAWTLVLTLALTLAWLDAFDLQSSPQVGRNWAALTVALTLGCLALTRPLTAVGVAVPFVLHGMVLLVRGEPSVRWRLVGAGLLAGGLGALLFLLQYAVTGDALLNPYTLWWPYDRVGFGPGVGLQSGGFRPIHALANTLLNFRVGGSDLFGWGRLSYLFLPFGIWALRSQRNAWLTLSPVLFLVLVYMLYWVGAWLFGPRYYYEGLPALVIISAAGWRWLAGRLNLAEWRSRLRFAAAVQLLVGLVALNGLYYLPLRLEMMRGLYQVSRSYLQPFEAAQAQLTPALIIVHPQEDWIEYGRLLELSSPFHNTPYVFILSRGDELNQLAIDYLPGRKVWHYYAIFPDQFFEQPLPTASP
jgi:hypothetical protein